MRAPLARLFAAGEHEPLEADRFHSLAAMRSLRKELSESAAALDALARALATRRRRGAARGGARAPPPLGREWHVVDLCCGKGVTSALAASRYPGVAVSAIDRLAPAFAPCAFDAGGGRDDGGGDRGGDRPRAVRYHALDVLAPDFVANLAALVRAPRRARRRCSPSTCAAG